MEKEHERIFLTYYNEEGERIDDGDVYWCQHNLNPNTTEYVKTNDFNILRDAKESLIESLINILQECREARPTPRKWYIMECANDALQKYNGV